MNSSTFNLFLLLIVSNTNFIFSQEIITSDGYSMGPKSAFMDVCNENMGASLPTKDALFSVSNFCNCMADELLPTFTKQQINYFFSEGNMDEMMSDSLTLKIISDCAIRNKKDITEIKEIRDELLNSKNITIIDSLIDLYKIETNYKVNFDKRLLKIASEKKWSDSKVEEVRSKCNDLNYVKWKMYTEYNNYSRDELVALYNYTFSSNVQKTEAEIELFEKFSNEDFVAEIDVQIKLASGELQK